MKLQVNSQRRHVLMAVVASTLQLLQPPFHPHSTSAATLTSSDPALQLLEMIPDMPYGAPATNSTIPEALAQQIEERAMALEEQGGRDLVKSPQLSGSWRLLYTNAREIRNLASGIPLGFVLGKVYQPVDTARGFFENQGSIEHKFKLARASNCVIGDVNIAALGTLNAAGTENTAGNRIDVFFRRITFSLDEILGQPVKFRKVIVTKQDPKAAQPANDITFLDSNTRVTRGGDDSIFIFRREDSDRAMLTQSERDELFREGGDKVSLFGNQSDTEANAPPELKKLIAPRDN
eukprot:CAMPEP_0177702128 /NCGR_PEP_ID=MMETSP0484_2-20121128/6976_1 /TAXON_ID=354590 /ORGANISM="Rhodomonas lens, Strain RHODO" /LENGTH=291 /DNA_ID=CAMNT_0019213401 /DNA_START=101 /DNA_END=976 /DNA_ORIENTATION=-